MRSVHGFSLLETVVAIAVCAIILAALATVNVNSLQLTRSGGLQIQATQMLDSLGRRVVGGADDALLPGTGGTVTFGYGELSDLFAFEGAGVPSDRFRASVSRTGSVSVGSSTLAEYEIEVCFQGASGERCVVGSTLARRNP
jgi:prepilin-type N-terminal cleavage/methylation domain-containing protein